MVVRRFLRTCDACSMVRNRKDVRKLMRKLDARNIVKHCVVISIFFAGIRYVQLADKPHDCKQIHALIQCAYYNVKPYICRHTHAFI